jgi:hypothetical protein
MVRVDDFGTKSLRALGGFLRGDLQLAGGRLFGVGGGWLEWRWRSLALALPLRESKHGSSQKNADQYD